jgi:hypothetical protein
MVMVDECVAEPDPRSMKELKNMGMVDLQVIKDEDDMGIIYSLGQIGDSEVDHTRQAEGMHYDNEVIFDDDVYDWIKKCVEKPFKSPKIEETSGIADFMGIRQPDVLGAYLKGSIDRAHHVGRKWSSVANARTVDTASSRSIKIGVRESSRRASYIER